ncbi:hypothetical protein CEXT_318141, partial [Caerostris extrusa]
EFKLENAVLLLGNILLQRVIKAFIQQLDSAVLHRILQANEDLRKDIQLVCFGCANFSKT